MLNLIPLQLCSTSEVLVSRLQACRMVTTGVSSPSFCDVPGIFSERLQDICQVYERYCVGVRDAVQLLGELKTYDVFERFVNSLCEKDLEQPALGSWLQKPVEVGI